MSKTARRMAAANPEPEFVNPAPVKSYIRLAFVNEDGTETASAVELPQARIDEMLRITQLSLGMSSRESTVAHVLHELVIARLDRMPNID